MNQPQPQPQQILRDKIGQQGETAHGTKNAYNNKSERKTQ